MLYIHIICKCKLQYVDKAETELNGFRCSEVECDSSRLTFCSKISRFHHLATPKHKVKQKKHHGISQKV